jgi:hypothetical protein
MRDPADGILARPFTTLLHAQSYVWGDRRLPLEERIASCDLLWDLAIRVAKTDKGTGVGPNSVVSG